MGQQVCLINPQNVKQNVAIGVVSGFRGIDKFHFKTIPNSWLKVDVKKVVCPNATFMYLHEAANQIVLNNNMGGNALWEEKYVRRA
jgi:hypothetical protein